jgi:hypothetical protein
LQRLYQVSGEAEVKRNGEGEEIALLKPLLRFCLHQLRGSLVFPVQRERGDNEALLFERGVVVT